MRRYALRRILLALLAAICCSELAAQAPAPKDSLGSITAKNPRRRLSYGRLPLSFEANQGQADERVKFLARGPRHTLYLSPSEAFLALRRAQTEKAGTEIEGIGIQLLGADSKSQIVGAGKLSGNVNYFIGNDPGKWITGVPTYSKARYQQVYPGIDLLFYGNEQQLESDFVVAPGSNPNQIRLQFEGGRGLRVSSQGDLILKTSSGEVRLLRPHVYQDIAGSRRDVSGHYLLHGAREVSFFVGKYDHALPLVIDPVLVYSTALNGANFAVGNGGGHGIAVDAAGNAYVTGHTDRSNFLPTPGGFTTANGNLFITKLNATGSAVDYTAVFGGTSSEVAMAIAVDSQGEPIVVGFTSSADFPTMNPIQASLPAGTHAFVTKLNAAGSALLYSTLLGGSGATGVGNSADAANALATDPNGTVYVTGYTNSVDFPTMNAVQPTCPDLQLNGYCNVQGFVAKLDPTQSGAASIVYSTFLGGKFPTAGQGVAVDASGNAYITGSTNAPDFATTSGAFQTTLVGGSDAFVSVLNPAGSGFVYSTYLGYGFGWGIAVDAQGDVYVTGATNTFGGTFPTTPGAFQTTLSGSTTSDHAFVAKLNPSGTALVYSTFLGGSGFEDSNTGNIVVDAQGNAYVSGFTSSADFPTTNALQVAFGGGNTDAFVAKLNPSGSGLIYSTYLGGSGDDASYGIAIDSSGSAYVMGTTTSANFPTTPGVFEPSVNTGTGTVFVTKIGAALTTTTLSTSVNPSVFGQQVSFTATLSPSTPSAVTPTGAVTFSDGTTTLGSATISTGTAIFNTNSVTVGSHSITAAYGGDSNFAPSTSTVLTQVVNQAGTTTSLFASPNPSSFGQSVTLTAAVAVAAPGSGTPTGTVTFLDGPTALGTTALNSAGNATLSTVTLSSGSHSLTAAYGSDTNFAASTSRTVTLTVQSSTTHFSVAAPASTTAGTAFSVTLTALNSANQTSTSYTGSVVLTSTDPQGVLPSIYTFTAGDQGIHIFSAVTLNTAGNQIITATDNANTSITGSSGPIAVSSPPPPIVRIADNEIVSVSDTESFPDVFDAEDVHVADAVFVTPLIAVTAPVAEFSSGGLRFGGQSGTQTITVSDIGQAPLTLASATISGSAQFNIAQISCSNGVASFPTTLLSGGVCNLTIGYTASATPGNDTATLVFTDNAALSNLPTSPAGTTYTQSVPLSGEGTNIGPPPPPPATVSVMDNEMVHVTEAESFPDVADPEKITVTDQVSVIPCDFTLTVNSPLDVSLGSSGSTSMTIESTAGCSLPVALSSSTPPNGISLSFSANPVTTSRGGSSASTLTVTAGPSVTPTSFTLTITGSAGPSHSIRVNVNVMATPQSITGIVQTFLNAGAIDSSGIGNALLSKLSATQSAINVGSIQTAINALGAFKSQVQAQTGKHILTSFTLSGITFNPANVLLVDAQGLIDSLRVGAIADPITGYAVNSAGTGIPGATVSIIDANGNTIANATTDITGFYYMATTGVLSPGANYTLQVSSLPAGFASVSPTNQPFVWQGAALAFTNFVLN